MIISYWCGAKVHHIRVRRGRITFLDYDTRHQAEDVVRALQQAPMSSCATLLHALRTRTTTQDAPDEVADLFFEITRVRVERFAGNLAFSNPTALENLLTTELGRWPERWTVQPRKLVVDDRLFVFDVVEFLRCRRFVLGCRAVLPGVRMGVDNGEGLLLPLTLGPGDRTMRVLVVPWSSGCYTVPYVTDAFLRRRSHVDRQVPLRGQHPPPFGQRPPPHTAGLR